MPYMWINLAHGHDSQTKRELLSGLTAVAGEVLEVGAAHTHAYLNEVPLQDIGVGGEEPKVGTAILISVVMSRGRPPLVLRKLMERIADVVESVLSMRRDAVHCVLLEQDASNIGVGGVPLAFPSLPQWIFENSRSVPANRSNTNDSGAE